MTACGPAAADGAAAEEEARPDAAAGTTARSCPVPYRTVIRPVSTAGSVVTATTDRASAAGAPYPTLAPSASTL